jgi:hypothetical protein
MVRRAVNGDRGRAGWKGGRVAVAAAGWGTERIAVVGWAVAAVVYDQSGEFELNHLVGESPCVTSGSTSNGRENTGTCSVSFTHLPSGATRYNDLLCIAKLLIQRLKFVNHNCSISKVELCIKTDY